MTISKNSDAVNIFDLAEEICAKLGIECPKNLNTDDRIYRTSTTDGRGRNKNGAIKLFSDGRGGIAWNWKTGETETFFVGGPLKQLTEAERQEIARRRKEAAEALERQYAEAAAKARRIWNSAALALPSHPYLERKGIDPYGVRERWGKLIIPVYGEDKTIISVQMIAGDGKKRFLKDARNSGIFVINAGRKSGPVLIAEGFATAASLAAATFCTVVCAFNASALGEAARRIRAQTDRPVIICGDNDHTAGKSEQQATEADAQFIIPDFEGFERSDKDTDFNDLAKIAGLTEVARQVRHAMKNGVHPPTMLAQTDEPRREETPNAGRNENSSDERGSARQYVNGPSHQASIFRPSVPVWRPETEIPNRNFIYGQHYIRKYVGITVAPGGTGKSALLTTEALSIVTGRSLIGAKPRHPRRVWYIGEDDPVELERRFAAAMKCHAIKPEDIGSRLMYDSFRTMPLIVYDGDTTGQSPAFANVEAFIKACLDNAIDVVMIDPFVMTHRAPENDNTEMHAAISQWVRISEMASIAVELVAHSRKGMQGVQQTVEDIRGASAQHGAARDIRLIVKMTEKEAEAMGINEKDRKRFIRVGDTKANMAEDHGQDWYKLQGVHLANAPKDENADNPFADNVQVVTIYRHDFWEGISKIKIDKVMRELEAKGQIEADIRSGEKWFGNIAKNILGSNEDEWIKAAIKKWMKSGAIVKFKSENEHRETRWFYRIGNWEFSSPIKAAEDMGEILHDE